jgi:hypothetical protein
VKGRLRRGARRVADDIRERRHLEAYSLFLVTLAFTIVGLAGDLPDRVTDPVVLAGLAFLIFWTTGTSTGGRAGPVTLDTVLLDRDAFGSFSELLEGATELWMYAPSGVNVLLRHTADIRRWLQRHGTSARVVVLDPDSASLDAARLQLDPVTDFDSALRASLATVGTLDTMDRFELRLLAANPGFSLVVLDPGKVGGRLIVEFHGFQDAGIGDRMHLEIRRSQSLHWFEYWAGRFEAIWAVAREPGQPPAPQHFR